MEMLRSDCEPMPQRAAGSAYSTLRLLGLGADMAGHLGLCRGVAMHAELSRRFYAEGRPLEGLPPGWTPWCNPGFLVRALQELLGEIHDPEVHGLCGRFIAQARALDGVNEAMAALLAPAPAHNGQALAERAPLAACLERIEEESERLWRRLQERLTQLGGEEPRPLQA